MSKKEPRSVKNPPEHIDEAEIDIYEPEGVNYPVLEHLNNALTWPEGPKGRIDLQDTFEISSVPEDPETPMESIETLKNKGVMPN